MRYRLLDILACPNCGGFPLGAGVKHEEPQASKPDNFGRNSSEADDIYDVSGSKEILSGTLRCPGCSAEFNIDGGIPDFVCEDSSMEDFVLKQKAEYDNIKYEKSYWYPQTVIDRTSSKIDESFDRDSFLLDLGTGAGVWANVFSNHFHVIGLDIDIYNLHNGRKKYPHIDFVCASVTKLPFRDSRISVVFSGLLLHHLYLLGLDKVFREIYRVLSSGGQFLAYEPNKYHPVTLLRFNLMHLLVRHLGQRFVWFAFGSFQSPEERLLSPHEVRATAVNAGFDSKVETCFGIPSIVLNRMPYLNKLSRLLEKNVFLAGSFFLDGRKTKHV